MKLITTGNAGTMESNDIMITVEPSDAGGVQVDLTSSVYQQFGKQIIAVIKETTAECRNHCRRQGRAGLHRPGSGGRCPDPRSAMPRLYMGGAAGCIRRIACAAA